MCMFFLFLFSLFYILSLSLLFWWINVFIILVGLYVLHVRLLTEWLFLCFIFFVYLVFVCLCTVLCIRVFLPIWRINVFIIWYHQLSVAFQDQSRQLHLWLVERRDRSWFWRPVVDLQHGPDIRYEQSWSMLQLQNMLLAVTVTAHSSIHWTRFTSKEHSI